MSRQYPIWKKISNNSYATDKSHGVRDTEFTVVNVGTSSKNSHRFLTTEIMTYTNDDGLKVFLYYVNGIKIKKAILRIDGTYEVAFDLLEGIK